MAENQEKPKKAKKAKKSASERAGEIAKSGAKGAVKAFALAAVAIAGMNDYAGVSNFGNGGAAIAKTDTKKRKAAANKIQPKWTKSGSLWNLAEADPKFVELRKLAKSAAGDIQKREYSGAVKAFLESMAERSAGGGGGMRTREELGELSSLL